MKKIFRLGALVAVAATIITVVVIGINATPINEKDIDAIKKVIIKASTQAEKNYIEAKISHKKGTLDKDKSTLADKDSTDMNDTFSDKMAQKLKRGWVDEEIANAETGPELVDCGITNIHINDISINGDVANVNATLVKYLVENTNKDGKLILNRTEGKVFDKVTLVKENGKWKISEFESTPDI